MRKSSDIYVIVADIRKCLRLYFYINLLCCHSV